MPGVRRQRSRLMKLTEHIMQYSYAVTPVSEDTGGGWQLLEDGNSVGSQVFTPH